MNTENNKQMAKDFFSMLARLFKGEEVDPGMFLAEDVLWHLPNSVEELLGVSANLDGRAAVSEVLGGVGNVYVPESTSFEFHSWVAEDDLVALHFTLRAETVTGKRYENHYQSLVRFSDGLIKEVWETFDTAYLFGLLNE